MGNQLEGNQRGTSKQGRRGIGAKNLSRQFKGKIISLTRSGPWGKGHGGGPVEAISQGVPRVGKRSTIIWPVMVILERKIERKGRIKR